MKNARRVLINWHGESTPEGDAGLDVLINNAAQTPRDTFATEKKAVNREFTLQGTNELDHLLVENIKGYHAPIRDKEVPKTLARGLGDGNPHTAMLQHDGHDSSPAIDRGCRISRTKK